MPQASPPVSPAPASVPAASGRRGGPRLRLLAALAWAALVAVLLLVPAPADGAPPAWLEAPWARTLAEGLAAFAAAGGDKLVHAGLFFVQALLAARVRRGRSEAPPRRDLVLAFGASVLWGALTEVGQAWGGARAAEPLDLVANVVGAALGVAWAGRRRRVREPAES